MKFILVILTIFFSTTTKAGEIQDICESRADNRFDSLSSKEAREYIDGCIRQLNSLEDEDDTPSKLIILDRPKRKKIKAGDRNSWYLGFEFQPIGSLTYDIDKFGTGSSGPDAFNFNIGFTFDKTLVGLNLGSVSNSYNYDNYSLTADINYNGIKAYYFPENIGYFASVGYAIAEISLLKEYENDDNIFVRDTLDEKDGYSISMGGGHAWWTGETLNLVADAEYTYYKFKGDSGDTFMDLTTARTLMLGFGLYWY
jgi:hypothetical protein